MLRATITAVSLLLAATACTPDFDKFWQPKDLRILAVKASPPEVLVLPSGKISLSGLDPTDTKALMAALAQALPATFPTVRVTALITDPAAPTAQVQWELWVCSTDDNNCDEATFREKIASGTSDQAAVAVDFKLTRELFVKVLQKDTFRGFGGLPVYVELKVARGQQRDRALKRLVYGVYGPGELAKVTGIPLDPLKLPNNNPSVDDLLFDFVTARPGWSATAGEKYTIFPVSPDHNKEDYVVQTFTGGTRQLEEHLTYRFFVTAGSLSPSKTGGKPRPFVTDKKADDYSTSWTAPMDEDSATFWVVVSDGRGGTGWLGPRTIKIVERLDGGVGE